MARRLALQHDAAPASREEKLNLSDTTCTSGHPPPHPRPVPPEVTAQRASGPTVVAWAPALSTCRGSRGGPGTHGVLWGAPGLWSSQATSRARAPAGARCPSGCLHLPTSAGCVWSLPGERQAWLGPLPGDHALLTVQAPEPEGSQVPIAGAGVPLVCSACHEIGWSWGRPRNGSQVFKPLSQETRDKFLGPGNLSVPACECLCVCVCTCVDVCACECTQVYLGVGWGLPGEILAVADTLQGTAASPVCPIATTSPDATLAQALLPADLSLASRTPHPPPPGLQVPVRPPSAPSARLGGGSQRGLGAQLSRMFLLLFLERAMSGDTFFWGLPRRP